MIALLASACLLGIALQSTSGRWLGWVALIPLFLCIRLFTPRRALFAGAAWGLGLFLFCATAPHRPIAFSPLNALLLVAVPAVYSWVGALLTRRVGFSPLLLGLAWVGVELALQPLELRHGLLAGTQGQGLIVRTMGYVAGSAVVAFIVAYVNATLLVMLSDACAVGGGSRLIRGSRGSERRLLPFDAPVFLLRLFSPQQPRAPPV